MLAPGEDFAGVPRAVQGALDRRRRVVTVLLDAFGWRFVQRHAEHPLLRRLASDGTLAPVASQFPSTTTAHVTTMHTGLPVGEHGLYEWRIWEPSLRRLITPILFSWAGDSERDTLAASGLAAADVVPPGPTLYECLAAGGVPSFVLQPAAFSPSTFDRAVARGATFRPYDALRTGLADLAHLVATQERCYAYLYFDGIDATGHRCGPGAPAFDEAVLDALDAVDAAFFGPRAPRFDDALLILTADHGQVDVSTERLDYLDDIWPELPSHLALDDRGEPIGPAGSARDVFLHARDDRVDDVVAGLRAVLDDRATVHATADLLADGSFGPSPGPRLRERIGSVCILPAARRMAWLRSAAGVERVFLGHHGGRHPDEAQTFV
ncbi:MAG: alkaline phosphatase family protein, partial [Conexibacter sp.]|nr:alkaline phosphatase family protein [Conexibacter sp.]